MDRITDQSIKTCIEARIPVIATGKPGTGKTAYGLDLEQWPCPSAPNGEHKVMCLIGSVREPTDIGGWPVRTPDGIKLEPPEWAVTATRLANEGFHVIIVWDEARTLTEDKQAALLKVIHENQVGDTKMPRSISHVAFANSVEDSAGGVPLEAPMANRHVFVPWNPSKEDWVMDMTTNAYKPQGLLTDAAKPHLAKYRALIAAFINSHNLLLVMPEDEEHRDGPWPSPRTWDYAAHLWAAADGEGWDFKEMLLSSAVGQAAAGEFINWRASLDLLTAQQILEGTYEDEKRGVKLVDLTRPDRTFAMLGNTLSYVLENWTKESHEAMWKCLAYCAENRAADIAAAFLPALRKSSAGKDVPPSMYAKYIIPFQSMLDRIEQ